MSFQIDISQTIYSRQNMRFADYLTSRYKGDFKITNNLGQVNLYRFKTNASWKAFDLLELLGYNSCHLDFEVAMVLLEEAIRLKKLAIDFRPLSDQDFMDWHRLTR